MIQHNDWVENLGMWMCYPIKKYMTYTMKIMWKAYLWYSSDCDVDFPKIQ